MTPTPIATPTKARIVILEAKYRNPRRMKKNKENIQRIRKGRKKKEYRILAITLSLKEV